MYPISDTTNRFYIDTGIEFFSDIFYMSIDRTVIEIVVISHDIFHERFSLYDGFGVFYEIVEDSKLGLRHLYLLS